MVLITLGSQSAAFHHWVHGDEVACSLVSFSPMGEASGGHASDEPDHDATDPLDPFCRTGFLSQVILLNPAIEPPQVFEALAASAAALFSNRISLSTPSRAPPVLI